ncbi:hypothetical protein AB0O76_18915 [Streptomyces sp. NPDC086554]|uniref:hypothetical protein n=1 Tax=Streptomyces sp. NPDC086554 TaxID=3154864 RepID=UPI0034169D1F
MRSPAAHPVFLVPGPTDDPANIEGVARFAASLGKDFTLRDTPSPTPEQVAAAKKIFAAQGLKAV